MLDERGYYRWWLWQEAVRPNGQRYNRDAGQERIGEYLDRDDHYDVSFIFSGLLGKKTSNLQNFFFCITCYGYPRPWSNAEQDCNKTEMTYIKDILGRRKRSFCFPTYAAPPRLSVCLFIKPDLSNDDDHDDDNDCQKIYFDPNNLISVRSQDLFRRHQSEQRLKFLGQKKLRSSCFDFFNFNVSSSLLAWSG